MVHKKGECDMLAFKIDVLGALKEKGYSTYYLREKTPLGSQAIQGLRSGKVPGTKSIDILCDLLDCQPGDLIMFKREE